MSDYIPKEILTDIFLRLPNKALGACMCVSKSWLCLIKDPTFVSSHLNKNKPSGVPGLFLLRTRSGGRLLVRYALHVDDNCFATYKQLVAPSDDVSFFLVGSCNGLVCFMHNLYTSGRNTFFLWNPMIRKSIKLPEPDVTFESHGPFEAFVGFGFDSRSKDYKVLRIVRLLDADDQDEGDEEEEDVVIEAEIFSLNKNLWKNITHKLPRHAIAERGSQAFVNGAVHWIAARRRDEGFRSSVLALDVETEHCRELVLPECMAKEDPRYLSIFTCGDSTIAVSRRKYLGYSNGEIWVMKEYGHLESWKKLFFFGEIHGSLPRPLGFRREGTVVFQLHNGDLVSIHPKGLRVEDLGVQGASGYSFLASFVETLALLDK